MKTITHERSYEYKCPECNKRLAPIDSKGEEVLGKKCWRVLRHKKGLPLRMVLVKLDRLKTFTFHVKEG